LQVRPLTIIENDDDDDDDDDDDTNVSSDDCLRLEENEGDLMTSWRRLFQTSDTVTGKDQSPMGRQARSIDDL